MCQRIMPKMLKHPINRLFRIYSYNDVKKMVAISLLSNFHFQALFPISSLSLMYNCFTANGQHYRKFCYAIRNNCSPDTYHGCFVMFEFLLFLLFLFIFLFQLFAYFTQISMMFQGITGLFAACIICGALR